MSGCKGQDNNDVPINGQADGESGKDGKPGGPGSSGYNFVGGGLEFHNCESLVIISNGGEGGKGGDGGNGKRGYNGSNANGVSRSDKELSKSNNGSY